MLNIEESKLLKFYTQNNCWIREKNKFFIILGNIIGVILIVFFLMMTVYFFTETELKSDDLGGLFMCFLVCFLPGVYFFVWSNLNFVLDFNSKLIYYSLFGKRFKIILGSHLRNVYVIELTQQTRYKGYQFYFEYSNDKNPTIKKNSDVTMEDMIMNPENTATVKVKNIFIDGGFKLRTEIDKVYSIMNQIIIELQT
jgi:hypothetical protein